MQGEKDKSKVLIELKSITGVENLDYKAIAEVLSTSAYVIENFEKILSGADRRVSGNWFVGNLNFSNGFRLSTAEEVMQDIASTKAGDRFLFLSDLINFVEQIRTSLVDNRNLKTPISSEQAAELDRLESTFRFLGISISDNKISARDLKKIENDYLSDTILKRIQLIRLILAPNLGALPAEEEKKPETEEEPEKKRLSTAKVPTASGSGGFAAGVDDAGGGETDTPEEPTNRRERRERREREEPDSSRESIKISELDPQSKLYLQSLSIITINQALNRYFSDAALESMGLQAGTKITFDQLPLDVRQQLMDRAFLQVETQLLSGQYSLNDLIKNSSDRINFSNQSALGLLIDIKGLKLINQAVKKLVENKDQVAFASEAKKNQEQELTGEKLTDRVKNETNATTTKQAEDLINKTAKDPDFARHIESALNVINSEDHLDDVFWQKLEGVIGSRDVTRKQIIVDNIRRLVEAYIKEGVPPEYFIPDPKRFDFNKFKNIFGNELTPAEFEKHQEELGNLIIFYWKRKRAIWMRDIRAEYGQESMTVEEALAKGETIENLVKRNQLIAYTVNPSTGGRQLAVVTANPSSDLAKNSQVLSDFIKQQQELIAKQLEVEINKQTPEQQQETFKVYFEYYLPGYQAKYNFQTFQELIIPQMSPMDYYMIAGGENLQAGAFNRRGDGFIQQAFGGQNGAGGDDLLNNKLTREGLKWAIKGGIAAATGGTAAPILAQWEAAKKADPTGMLQRLEDEGLSAVIEFIKKHWFPILLVAIGSIIAALGPILLILLPVAFAIIKYFPELKALLFGGSQIAGKEILGAENLTRAQQQVLSEEIVRATKLAEATPTLTSQISSSTMLTASQAVAATVVGTVSFVLIYQASLNSAFLTDFPTSESEIINFDEKTSKYASIEKKAKIIEGCPQPENDAKCENPSFPISIEYTVTIKPKEDFSLQIIDIKDTIEFKQSQKGWEEAGQTPPIIPSKKELDFNYFKEIIKEQGGEFGAPINSTPTPLPTGETTLAPTIEDAILIPAGGELTFTYKLENLGSDYNHTSIVNTIEANFYYQNSYLAGTDSVITAARACLGQCGGDIGCWPTTGDVDQLPFGPYTHGAPGNTNNSWGDSFDIGCDNCSGAAIYGPNIYARYDGELKFMGCDDNQYGCRYILAFEHEGQTLYEDYAHMQEPNPAITSGSMTVEAGFPIGRMSNRGTKSVHLHWGIVNGPGGGWWGSKPAFSLTMQLVPETDQGNKPAKEYDHVTTCYE